MPRQQPMTGQPEDSFETWLRTLPQARSLAEAGAQLRAATSRGGAGGQDPDAVARYFRPGRRTEAELVRLWDDAELRRSVASVGWVLAESESPRTATLLRRRPGHRWLGLGLLAAASLAGLFVLPSLLDNRLPNVEHRSANVTAGEVQIVAPLEVRTPSPFIEWYPVLGADVYEVEVTDARGRTVYSERTDRTALEIPTERLERGSSYFFRVRAQVDVGRWISSDFQEIVVP